MVNNSGFLSHLRRFSSATPWQPTSSTYLPHEWLRDMLQRFPYYYYSFSYRGQKEEELCYYGRSCFFSSSTRSSVENLPSLNSVDRPPQLHLLPLLEGKFRSILHFLSLEESCFPQLVRVTQNGRRIEDKLKKLET